MTIKTLVLGSLAIAALAGCQQLGDLAGGGAPDPEAALAGQSFKADMAGQTGLFTFLEHGGLKADWDSGTTEIGSWSTEEGETCIYMKATGEQCGALTKTDGGFGIGDVASLAPAG